MTPYFNHPALLHDKEKTLIFSCYEAEKSPCATNSGKLDILFEWRSRWRKKTNWKISSMWQFYCSLYYGIMLLCESNPVGIDNLLEILNDEHGKHWLRNCWTMLRQLVVGTTLYQIPNFQACHKIGMGHWNRDEPYPYGYEEFVVTCKRCSIDLEMFKLVNRLL